MFEKQDTSYLQHAVLLIFRQESDATEVSMENGCTLACIDLDI